MSNLKVQSIISVTKAGKIINRISRLFQPINVVPKNAQIKNQNTTSKSQRLMLELGIIRQASPGSYHLLPLSIRALEKLVHLVDNEMKKIDAQKVEFPTLTNSKLWKATGRLEQMGSELFTIIDRHKNQYILSPTHEEAATELLSALSPLSYKSLPLKLYQITEKYRDEIKPRFGLMRGRQFLMKDLYSFDADIESANKTYEAVCESYKNIFNRIGIEYVKVIGASGNMGGNLSHEYQFLSDVGEDQIVICSICNHMSNMEVSGGKICSKCKSEKLTINNGIEVGHTFMLGEKYSKQLNATCYLNDRTVNNLQMGSYGLGLTRIIAASIEVLALEHEIRWPLVFAPYFVCIIPPKEGSKEENKIADLPEKLYDLLDGMPVMKDNVIMDDRRNMTIGKRILEAKRTGYPYIVALGSKATENPALFEILDVKNNTPHFLTQEQLIDFFNKELVDKINL